MSDGLGLILPGVNPYPYVETVPLSAASGNGALPGGANDLVLGELPAYPSPDVIAKIRVWVSTTGGNADVGVWTFDGTTWTLLASSGSVAVGSNGTLQTLTLGSAITRQRGGRYFLGLSADSGTPAFGRPSAILGVALGLADNRFVRKPTSFPLATNAASFTTGDVAGTTSCYWLRGVAS